MQAELDFDIVLTAYGLTEASGFGTMCRADDDAVTVATTCGRPIADFELRIDGPDDTGAGEVLLRGPNVMLGYLDDPEATAAAIDADGWLHTGDIGTVDAAGNLRITDRLKDMYICGGFNVYPAEVEQVLARLDGVADAAVIGVPDERLGEVGRAFVVRRPGSELDEQAVIDYTRKHLANFKAPRSVVFVDAAAAQPRRQSGQTDTARDGLMDLTYDDATREFRDEVRDFLAANTASFPTKSYDTAEGFEQHRRWDQVLFDAGLSVITWPEKYGGRDATLLQWVVYEEEYFRAGAPGRASANGTSMLAPTLFAHGTEEQLDRVLPKMASGEEIWAQAWSEPESGSDLASLRSTATQTDGGWLLNGQKIWSSRAPFGDRAFGLFRSDPDAERHRGLTYFMFDLKADGVTVRPIAQLGGDTGFGEIFFDDVFVPDHDVIGAVHDGWRAAMSTTSNERGMSLRSPARFLAPAERLVQAVEEPRRRPRLRRPGGRRLDQGAGLPAAHLRHRDPARRGRRARRRVVGDQGVLVGSRRRAAPDRPGAARRRRRARRLLDRRSALRARRPDLRRHQRDSAQHHRRAAARSAQRELREDQMKFALDEQQRDFAASIDAALGAADVPGAVRAWGRGDTAPGRKVWATLTDLGVTALAVPEKFDGIDAHPVDLVVALERAGALVRARPGRRIHCGGTDSAR